MIKTEIKNNWESAAPGWAKWESTIAAWMNPATDLMLDMAGVVPGARILDVACGAGSQSLIAAKRVGKQGHVVASDISETMIKHVLKNANQANLKNISAVTGAAEELLFPTESFDAAICRLSFMLFAEPQKAMIGIKRILRVGGKLAVIVFTLPKTNAFMSKPMQILLHHAGKKPPKAGQPGIFSLGAPGILEQLFTDTGFNKYEQYILRVPLRLPSAKHALNMIQEAFGAYRAVLSNCSQSIQTAAWLEVFHTLQSFEKSSGFEGSMEILIGAGVKSN